MYILVVHLLNVAKVCLCCWYPFLVHRGAVTTWRPKITPMSELKPSELQTHTLPGDAPPVQRTSLAANQQVNSGPKYSILVVLWYISDPGQLQSAHIRKDTSCYTKHWDEFCVAIDFYPTSLDWWYKNFILGLKRSKVKDMYGYWCRAGLGTWIKHGIKSIYSYS